MDQLMKTAEQAAVAFHKRNTNLDLDDLISEAHLIMIDAFHSYDPTKGRSLKSWVGFLVHRNLRKKFWYKLKENELELETYGSDSLNPERVAIFKETLNNFSEASKEVVSIIFDKSIHEKNEIKKEMRKKGFAWNKIQAAFSELRTFANSMT